MDIRNDSILRSRSGSVGSRSLSLKVAEKGSPLVKLTHCNVPDVSVCQFLIMRAALAERLSRVYQHVEAADDIVLPYFGDDAKNQELDHHIIQARDILGDIIEELRS